MPLYCTFEAVRARLIGKVKFTESETDENKMFVGLATNLINEAEGQVESDLSPRYAAPFQTIDDKAFSFLPERPTKQLVRTLAELQSVQRILETDFGRGTVANGDKYCAALKKRYNEIVIGGERMAGLLSKRRDGAVESQGWALPPLPGLKLNWGNTTADDGFMGSVIVASGSASMSYPKDQINDPSATWWYGVNTAW